MEIDLTNGGSAPAGGSGRGAFADAIADEFFSGGNAGDDAAPIGPGDGSGREDAGGGASARGPSSRRPEPATEEGPRERQRRAEREDEDDEFVPGEVADAPPGDDDGEPEGDAEQEGVTEPEHALRGSQDEPFTVKDLPTDKYIELTIDGEKRTVSLAEMGKGYIREETFHQRVGKVQQQAQEALEGMKKAQAMRGQLREELQTLLHDPDQLYEFFTQTEDREQVLEAVAHRYAKLLRAHRDNPEERLRFQRERDVRRLQAERAHWERERAAEAEAAQQKLQAERAMKIFKPGWEQGLKKAGFPTPTQALYEEVMVRCDQRERSGQPVTSDDVAEFTRLACKLLELPPRGRQRPAPAPEARPREESRAARAQRRDKFAGMSRQERIRDPDYFLQGIPRRDLGI